MARLERIEIFPPSRINSAPPLEILLIEVIKVLSVTRIKRRRFHFIDPVSLLELLSGDGSQTMDTSVSCFLPKCLYSIIFQFNRLQSVVPNVKRVCDDLEVTKRQRAGDERAKRRQNKR